MGVRLPGGTSATVGSATSTANADGTVTVTITGSGFVDGMTVTVNGWPCTGVIVKSPTTLTCVLPNGTIALVNIILTLPGGTSSGSKLTSPIVSLTAMVANQLAGVGTPWQNIANVLSNDGLYTDATANFSIPSPLKIMGYFTSALQALPPTVTIQGVTASCFVKGFGNSVGMGSMKLVIGGLTVGTNQASGEGFTTNWAMTPTYGSSNSTWGVSLSPSTINASDFGIELIVVDNFMTAGNYSAIDYCLMSVYFQ